MSKPALHKKKVGRPANKFCKYGHPVTQENTRWRLSHGVRGSSWVRDGCLLCKGSKPKKLFCKHGHLLTDENTRWVFKNGHVIKAGCRECNRGRSWRTPKPKPTHCPRGHLLSEENTGYRTRLGRTVRWGCLACRNLKQREWKKLQSDRLTDYYIKNTLRQSGFTKGVTRDLIDLYRNYIKLKRKIKLCQSQQTLPN